MEVKLTIDFGLLVLILLVQLWIYPGFRFISQEDFISAHRLYTKRISVIVAPLMLLQAGLHAYVFPGNVTLINSLQLLLIGLIWVNTFGFAVPLHNKLQNGKSNELIERLIRVNKWRTLAWTIIFLLGLLEAF